MFEPTDRHNLVDLLRPPAGYRLDAAVGTTYSLDFVALTAVLSAFVDAEPEAEGGRPNPADVLRAITRLSTRVRVFVQRGRMRIDPGGGSAKLSCLFDTVVREVRPEVGCFHPKVWAARYVPRQLPGSDSCRPLIRILCGSRNLSTSQCWEDFISFEGEETGRQGGSGIGPQCADFVRRLGAGGREGPLRSLVAGLQRSRFELPAFMQDACNFVWQRPGGDELLGQLPASGDRALIVSPFVRKTFLDRAMDRFGHLTLVTTQRELDRINDGAFHARLGDGHDVFVIRPANSEGESSAMELHAKLVSWEAGGRTATIIGSANASDSAWRGRNCEAVVRFSPGIPIRHFRERYLFDQNGQRWGWVERYERREHVETEEDIADQALDELCELISGMYLFARYDRGMSQLKLHSRDAAAAGDVLRANEQVEVLVCPLAALEAGGSAMPLRLLVTEGITFGGVELADLSEFFAFQLTHRKVGDRRVLVIKAESDYADLRGERDAAVLRKQLTPEAFRDFLRGILFDGALGRPWTGGGGATTGVSPFGGAFLADATIEDVIQSCTEDPSRIQEIDSLLRAFQGTGFVDPLFVRFWKEFRAAFDKARDGGGTDG